MSETLLVLLIGGSALGLAGVLALLSGSRRGHRGKPVPAETGPPAPHKPFQPPECPPLLFAASSSQLSSEAKATLRAWAGELADRPEFRIVVVGSADTAGNPSRNRALARERAQAAARLLAAAGVPAGRLEVRWQEPEPGRTGQEQAALRRVGIHAVLDESPTIPDPQK